MNDTDLNNFMAHLLADEPIPVDLESRLLADGIDTNALRETHA